MVAGDRQRAHVEHPIPPFFDERSEVLVLGSFPSPASRAQKFFYGHPQNRMWKMLARMFDEPVPATVARRADFLLRHHIAMWDVLASCDIEGASDASIVNAVPNDLAPILSAAPIKAIYCAGGAATKLYAKHIEPVIGRPAAGMPSTSPANAAWTLDALVDAWSSLRDNISEEPVRVLDVADVVALEQRIAQSGTSLAELMDRAGTWLAYRVHAYHAQCRVVVLAGNGNNGGDGWVAARELAQWGHAVSLVSAKPASEIKAQPARDAALAATEALDRAGAEIHVLPSRENLVHLLEGADVVVDAILGTGFSHDKVRAPFGEWIEAANAARAHGAYLVAADCPSGLNAQTGDAAEPCIQADETLTMICLKTGLCTANGERLCGTVRVAHLGDLAPFAL